MGINLGVTHVRVLTSSAIAVGKLAVLLAFSTPVQAQVADSQSAEGVRASAQWAQRTCLVSSQPIAGSKTVEVLGLCWGTGLTLGEADSFSSSINADLKATVVKIELLGRSRVLLLHADAAGNPVAEDISGSLARGAGRAPWANIDDLDVDLTDFTKMGRLSVTQRINERAAQAGEVAVASPFDFDVSAHVEAENQRAAFADTGVQ